MAKTEKRRLGDLGEEMAAKFLVERGFEILDRNYLKKWGEIDIVARKQGKLHFLEVKTAAVDMAVLRETGIRPEENVHEKKLERLSRAISSYLAEKRLGDTDWQIGVLVSYIDVRQGKGRVKYISDI